MDKDVSEGGHSFQFFKKLRRDDLFFSEYLKDLSVGFRFSISPVGNDVISDVQKTFNAKMKITFGRSVDKGVFLECLDVLFLDRFQNLDVPMKPLQSRGYQVLPNQNSLLT